ncbi:MAG: lysylphosphatidylglycerol synthase domain-containing protein [Bacteroidota bacterium]|nr:lysylphosphatidylglycerol synthase domain-containing protein [Bacteroidota bacterium]
MLSKKTLGVLLKITIVVFALYFLYRQLISKRTIDGFDIEFIQHKIINNQSSIFLVLLMMFLNWFLEAVKWKFLIKKIEKVSLLTALRAVFSGITVSVFTPNRVGEYGGRVFCLEKADRIQGVLITVMGSMAQLLTTIFFGSIGILFLNNYIPELDRLYQEMGFAYPLIFFTLLFLNILLILLFHNISVISNLMDKFNWLRKYQKYKEVFTYYNAQELMMVFLLSIFRYTVFTTQFFILLKLFAVDISYFDAIILSMVMLFAISVIPTIAISEIGIRGSVALYLFSLVSLNVIGILSATFLLWVINLLIPAIVGTFFVFTLKFFRK